MLGWIWLAVGVVLLISELVLPGLIAGFLGAAAVLTAGLIALGVIEDIANSALAWMGMSVVLLVVLRGAVARRFPSDVTRDPLPDDAALYGTVVEVLEAVQEDQAVGRIRLHGTSWPAISNGGSIPAGARARLVYRDNLAWHVEPALELENDNPKP